MTTDKETGTPHPLWLQRHNELCDLLVAAVAKGEAWSIVPLREHGYDRVNSAAERAGPVVGIAAITERRAAEVEAMIIADKDGRHLNAQGHQQAINAIDFCVSNFAVATVDAPTVSTLIERGLLSALRVQPAAATADAPGEPTAYAWETWADNEDRKPYWREDFGEPWWPDWENGALPDKTKIRNFRPLFERAALSRQPSDDTELRRFINHVTGGKSERWYGDSDPLIAAHDDHVNELVEQALSNRLSAATTGVQDDGRAVACGRNIYYEGRFDDESEEMHDSRKLWAADLKAALSRQPSAPASTALEWYAEQVEGCRKIGSEGDAFRHALDRDGGQRALAALAAVSTSVAFPDREETIKEVVGRCNRIPGATTWNAAEFMYDDLRAAFAAKPEGGK